MKRLKTGMKVHVDAGKGRLTIIREEGQEAEERKEAEEEGRETEKKEAEEEGRETREGEKEEGQ